AEASPSEKPGFRLNEIVLATKRLWWLTPSGVLPVSKCDTADSGIIVSDAVLTAAPVEVAPFPVLASALFCALRSASPAIDAAVEAAVLLLPVGTLASTVPAAAWVVCVPLAAPPDVLT